MTTHEVSHPSRVQAEEPPEESAAADPGGFFPSLGRKLAGWRKSAAHAYDAASHTGRQLWILAAIASLAALLALFLWGAYAAYGFVSQYLEPTAEAKPPAVTEVVEPSGPGELEKAKREAQRALEEAERERQLNVARMQADKYEWETWQQTVRATEENKKRLAEKQRIAEEQAAEEARLASIEEQKRLEEERRMIAAKAPEARAASRTKRRMKSFH